MNHQAEDQSSREYESASRSPTARDASGTRDSEAKPNTARIRELKERFDKFRQSREIIDSDRVPNMQPLPISRSFNYEERRTSQSPEKI